MTSRFLRAPRDTPLAMDRSSVRTVDADGRLRVSVANISKAGVNGYYGREIPNADALGLDPGRLYQLFRPPEELAKAAASWNGQPLLSTHRIHTAADHQPDLVVGSTGTDTAFRDPFLQTSLVVWAPDAIAGINDGSQRALSSAYRYKATMRPGVFQGERYDGIMSDLTANHVALVDRGRAGDDVVVGDRLPRAMRKPIWRNIHMATDATETDDGKIVATLMQFLGDRLQPEELDAVKAILDGQPAPSTAAAMDRARLRVGLPPLQRFPEQTPQEKRDSAARVPNADRLGRRA